MPAFVLATFGCHSGTTLPDGGSGGAGGGDAAAGDALVAHDDVAAQSGAGGQSGAPGMGGSGGMGGAAACYPLFHDCALDTECCAPNRCLNITGTRKCQVEGPQMTDGGGGSAGGSGDGGAMTCADLAARAAALLGKDCTASDQCTVTTVYNCCTVYTGIRADAKAAFESAQAEHTRACPDLRGCQCQDHTETNELVPLHQPPLPVSATCDLGKCTAHQK